jgi:hypothetical protein
MENLNKHLKAIINNYINFELKFKNELLTITERLLEPFNNNWYYYENYIICSEKYGSDETSSFFQPGHKITGHYKTTKGTNWTYLTN